MRLRAANCVLLACLAAALAAPESSRSKRHLQQWKNAILAKLFGKTTSKEENVRFFRIPGHDNILVKAVPKIDTIETVVAPENIEDASPTIAVLKSYLGTKSASETMSALQGVKHLLQSGILSVRHEPSEVFPYEKSAFLVPPFVSERIEFIQPRPDAVPGPPNIQLIPVLPPAAEAPEVIEEIIPINAIPTRAPELVPYPKFSYKQLKKDGSVVKYTVRDEISSDVVVTESNKPMPRPPSFIVNRLRKIFLRFPLETEVVPLNPLPPTPSLIPFNHIPFEVYSQSEIPPIHSIINIPKGEVHVHTNPSRKVNINDKLGSFTSSAETKDANKMFIAKKPAVFMPPPPPFIMERIENAAAISVKVPKVKKPSKFVNREEYIDEQEFLRNPGHVFYNPQPFAAPLTSGYVYRRPSALNSKPITLINVINKPVIDSKGTVTVKVNKNHVVTTKPNDHYYQQIQHGFQSKLSLGGMREESPIVVITKSVHKMPVPPIHIVERIQNVAAKAYSVPNISRGYAFKINHEPLVNANKKEFSTEQPTSNKVESGITKSLRTKDNGAIYFAEPVLPSYIYKQISHSNPQPFTVVQVEDKTTYKPVVPVTITHEHVHTDGSTYKCKENHQFEEQLPKDYFYVPPVTAAEMRLPTTHKVEKLGSAESQFSYVQRTNNGVFTNKDGAGAFNDGKQSNIISSPIEVKVTSEKTSPKNAEAFSDNLIVVPDTTYSFTQTHSNGSAMNVGKGVTLDLSEIEKRGLRGDIPEDF